MRRGTKEVIFNSLLFSNFCLQVTYELPCNMQMDFSIFFGFSIEGVIFRIFGIEDGNFRHPWNVWNERHLFGLFSEFLGKRIFVVEKNHLLKFQNLFPRYRILIVFPSVAKIPNIIFYPKKKKFSKF